MTNIPRTAVVVPVRNRTDLLRACLQSLVQQDIDPHSYEILVCDDGSTEDIDAVIKEFQSSPAPIRLLRQPAKGPAAARNMGFGASQAPMFVCLDSDMTCEKGFVRMLVEAMESNAEWVAAESHISPTAGQDSPLWEAPTNGEGTFISGATAYRAIALKEVGGFDEAFALPANEDFEIGIRLNNIGTFGYVPDAIAFHPRRKVTFATFWKWRRFWRYTLIVAKRYGVFGVPNQGKTTQHPRSRTALAALITMPAGRLLKAAKYCTHNPREGTVAISHAIFECVCGLCAMPEILLSRCPERKNYLSNGGGLI